MRRELTKSQLKFAGHVDNMEGEAVNGESSGKKENIKFATGMGDCVTGLGGEWKARTRYEGSGDAVKLDQRRQRKENQNRGDQYRCQPHAGLQGQGGDQYRCQPHAGLQGQGGDQYRCQPHAGLQG